MCVRRRAGEAADTELKTKTPHVNVGNKWETSEGKVRKSCDQPDPDWETNERHMGDK